MATGYIIWSEQQRKQINSGVFTSSADANAYVTRISKKSPNLTNNDVIDVVTVTYK